MFFDVAPSVKNVKKDSTCATYEKCKVRLYFFHRRDEEA